MRPRKINGHTLSIKRPDDLQYQEPMPIPILDDLLSKFISTYLRGAMDYECISKTDDAVKISVERTAHMLRALLVSLNDECLVHLTMEVGKELTLTALLDCELPPLDDIAEISVAAGRAGFATHPEPGRIRFTARLERCEVHSLYATPPRDYMREFEKIFFL